MEVTVSRRVSNYLARPATTSIAGDIGGTNVRFAKSRQGQLLGGISLPMNQFRTQADLVARAALEIEKLGVGEVKLGGIGFPCPFDADGEPLFTPPNIAYGFTGFIKSLTERTQRQFYGFNDAQAAVMGEAMFGAGMDSDIVFWHGLGTGYGLALVNGEQVFASEAGHTKLVNPLLDPGARKCGCDGNGCAEAYVSGKALSEQYFERTGIRLTGEALGNALGNRQDPIATEVFRKAMSYFAMNISNASLSALGGVHVIGGGVARMGDYLLETVREMLRHDGMVSWSYGLAKHVKLFALGDNSGLMGAAVLAEQKGRDAGIII
jgi:glucokinase